MSDLAAVAYATVILCLTGFNVYIWYDIYRDR